MLSALPVLLAWMPPLPWCWTTLSHLHLIQNACNITHNNDILYTSKNNILSLTRYTDNTLVTMWHMGPVMIPCCSGDGEAILPIEYVEQKSWLPWVIKIPRHVASTLKVYYYYWVYHAFHSHLYILDPNLPIRYMTGFHEEKNPTHYLSAHWQQTWKLCFSAPRKGASRMTLHSGILFPIKTATGNNIFQRQGGEILASIIEH